MSGPAGGNQGAEGSLFFFIPVSLNSSFSPPVGGALGVIGLSGRTHYQDRLSGYLVEPDFYND